MAPAQRSVNASGSGAAMGGPGGPIIGGPGGLGCGKPPGPPGVIGGPDGPGDVAPQQTGMKGCGRKPPPPDPPGPGPMPGGGSGVLLAERTSGDSGVLSQMGAAGSISVDAG